MTLVYYIKNHSVLGRDTILHTMPKGLGSEVVRVYSVYLGGEGSAYGKSNGNDIVLG